MKRADAAKLLAHADVICSPEEVHIAVLRLAQEITARLHEECPMVLSIMGGAAVFSGQLLPHLEFPLEFAAIELSRYRNAKRGGEIEWRLAPKDDVKGRTVLVLDDILDEGVTLAAVRDALLEKGAKRVHFAVFADKRNGRKKPISADFVGVEVPDRYVFGFGMDIHGLWRNLPAVYAARD